MITRPISLKGLIAAGILCVTFVVCFCSVAVAQSVASSDYFPLTPGTKWTYIVNGKDTVKCSVLKEKVKVGGVETSVLYYPQRNIKQNYTSDSQGIRLHQMPIEDLCIDGYGCFDLTVTLSPPIVLAGGTMSIGQSFNTSGTAKASLPYYGPLQLPYSASFRFEGFETVSVPAATFRAVKLSGSYTIAGQTIGDTLFLAQDLGVAKRINEYEETYTWELQSTTAGFVRLLTPTGGEMWESGVSHNITWEASEDAARFSLMYSIDNGVAWNFIEGAETLTDTSFGWIVPPQPGNKKKSLVKLAGYNDAGITVEEDISEPFTIEVVRLISPNGGEGQVLTSAVPHTIEWAVNDTIRPVDSIQLFYTTDGGKKWKPVGDPLAGDATTHDWLVPPAKKPKTQCKVKVVLMDEDGKKLGNDVSDSFFTIQQ
jgi:hypothetical protein